MKKEHSSKQIRKKERINPKKTYSVHFSTNNLVGKHDFYLEEVDTKVLRKEEFNRVKKLIKIYLSTTVLIKIIFDTDLNIANKLFEILNSLFG